MSPARVHVLCISGPNLQLLGTREPEIYGKDTLAEIHARLETRARALGATLDARQTQPRGDDRRLDRRGTRQGRRRAPAKPRRLHAHVDRDSTTHCVRSGCPASRCTSPTPTPARPSGGARESRAPASAASQASAPTATSSRSRAWCARSVERVRMRNGIRKGRKSRETGAQAVFQARAFAPRVHGSSLPSP